LSNGCVVDASVVVAAAVDEGPDGRWCEDLVLSAALAAPEIVLVEATNILRRLEQSGSVAGPLASLAFEDVMALGLSLYPYGPFASRAWELRRNLTAYDAWYVALAEALAVPLATLDRRLVRANGPRCEFRHPPA
jgi:predicted nucleic acid-binding protein